jgi:hypothetical protein
MKRILLLLALFPGLGVLRADEYIFETSSFTLLDASGNPLTFSLNLELGAFSGTFAPTATNLTSWPSSWLGNQAGNPTSSGYYDGSQDPAWSTYLALNDNTVYAEGTQLYLWAYDSQTPGVDSQWVLLTDPSWTVLSNAETGFQHYLYFSTATTAIFGSFSSDAMSAATATAVSAVPEPATWTALSGLLALGLAIHRRRRRPASAASATPALHLDA